MSKSMYKVIEGKADLNLIVKITIRTDINFSTGGIVDVYTSTRPKNIITQVQLKSDYDLRYKSLAGLILNEFQTELDKLVNSWLEEQAIIDNNQKIWINKLKLLGFE